MCNSRAIYGFWIFFVEIGYRFLVWNRVRFVHALWPEWRNFVAENLCNLDFSHANVFQMMCLSVFPIKPKFLTIAFSKIWASYWGKIKNFPQVTLYNEKMWAARDTRFFTDNLPCKLKLHNYCCEIVLRNRVPFLSFRENKFSSKNELNLKHLQKRS